MPLITKDFNDWPKRDKLTIKQLVALYEKGLPGALHSEEEQDGLRAAIEQTGGEIHAEDVLYGNDMVGAGDGELSAPFVYVDKVFPGCWPASGQQRGDCVSHSTRNAILGSMALEVAVGEIDPVSGKREQAPQVSAAARKDGVFATETLYWYRRHGSDGWYCPASVKVAIQESGLVPRKNYPGIADLTRYSGKTAGKYGRTPPKGKVADAIDDNRMRSATECDSFEEISDLLANGYFITSCGSEGWDSTRDENGVAKRKGSWAHAMAYIAADDRTETHRRYGGPLVLVLNSWGPRWNSGPRRIKGTDIDIPEGSFWAKWIDLKRRNATAISGANGWPARDLTYLGGWK